MTRRDPLIPLLAAAVLVCTAPAAAPAAGVTDGAYRMIEGLMVRFDADGNDVLDAAERTKLEAHVARRFKKMGSAILDAAFSAADTNADGRITKAEWQTLGKHVLSSAGEAHKLGTRQSLMVPMSDGVKLATDVFLPAGEGPWPAVLSRTPYNKGKSVPTAWVRRGYAVVKQDMRGRFASEGENLPFLACGWGEHRDGFDTVAWIRKQPWSDGKVGTIGGSALGITQNLMAGAAPEGLACQHITVAAFSMYHHAAYVGGALRKSQVERWLRGNRFDPEALRLFAAHPTYDAWWHGLDCTRRTDKIAAPGMHVGGWFDTFSQGTVHAFMARQHGGAPGAKGNQKLVMGPWGHGISPRGKVGELTFPKAMMPLRYNPASWMAHWLNGAANGADKLPAVAYYVMGDTSDRNAPGNEWRFADDWPIPAEPTAYYFHGGGKLSRSRPAGVAGKPYAEYTFDPAKPCPTVGGCNLVLPKGPMDQRRVEKRGDVLTFTTEPLTRPVEVTGNPTAVVGVSSSAVDTDLSVRFCDVYPDGRSFLMAEGMLRLRYRKGFATPEPLAPGETVEVTVRCWPTSVVVNRGHRIRVSVTSSNSPRFDVNPGTGRPHTDGGKTVRQTNRIHLGGTHESRIVLPVVKARKKAA